MLIGALRRLDPRIWWILRNPEEIIIILEVNFTDILMAAPQWSERLTSRVHKQNQLCVCHPPQHPNVNSSIKLSLLKNAFCMSEKHLLRLEVLKYPREPESN